MGLRGPFCRSGPTPRYATFPPSLGLSPRSRPWRSGEADAMGKGLSLGIPKCETRASRLGGRVWGGMGKSPSPDNLP